MTKTSDLLIIGGGIIGLTAAWVLRARGLTVSVYEQGEFGREASWAGAGIIPPGTPEFAQTPLDRLRSHAARHLPEISQQLLTLTGIDNGFRRNGGIEILLPEHEYAVPLWQAEQIRFQNLTAAELQIEEPGLHPEHGTPYYLPDMAQLRNPWHMKSLIRACELTGVQLHPQTAVAGWLREGSRISGVRLADGTTRSAQRYLVAGGAWSDRLLGELGCTLGVIPVRGQIVLFRGKPGTPRHVVIQGKEYLVPRADGRVLAGSTEEPEAGFVKANTSAGVDRLVRFARGIYPALESAEIEKTWAGLRPGSPDEQPFIGPVPGYPEVLAAVGHFRAGVQLSLGTSERIADWVLERNHPDKQAFRLDRKPSESVKPAFRS